MALIEMTSDLSRKDNPQNITKIIGRPSPTAIARDAKRIGKFLLSPKGLLYTGKQFVLQIMNPNTENVKGKAGIGLTKIYDPLSPLTNAIGAPLGLRTTRHMPPVVRAASSTYEGIHKLRNADEEGETNNRLLRLKTELMFEAGTGTEKETFLKKLQNISNTIQGHAGATINTLSGVTGPTSLGGIGLTTIRRYEDTRLKKQLKLKTSHPEGYGILRQTSPGILDKTPPESKESRVGKALFDGGDKRKQAIVNQYKQIMYGQIPDRSNQPSIPSQIVRFDRLKETGQGNVKSYYDNESARQSNFGNTLQLIETINNAKAIDETENYSIIDFQFNDIKFKAYLGTLSDNFAPGWDSANDVGRADPRYQYTSFERTITFDFRVVIESKKDATVIWQKLQDLARFTHPVYGSEGFFGQTTNITIGKLFNAKPMIITDLGYDWDNETPWEIDSDLQHPMYTNVAMSCTILGDRPQSNSMVYGIKDLT